MGKLLSSLFAVCQNLALSETSANLFLFRSLHIHSSARIPYITRPNHYLCGRISRDFGSLSILKLFPRGVLSRSCNNCGKGAIVFRRKRRDIPRCYAMFVNFTTLSHASNANSNCTVGTNPGYREGHIQGTPLQQTADKGCYR